MDFRALNNEYLSIYSKNTSAESLTEDYTYNTQNSDTLDEEYEMIIEDIISEEDVIEDLVYDMLDEGFEPEEIEEIFEEILDEARVDMAARAAARKQYMASSEKSAREAKGRAAAKERSDKRAAQVAAVKGKVKSAIGKAKKASSDAKSAVKAKVKDTKQQSHVGLAKYASKRNLMKGAGLKTQSSKGRGELRKAVAKDIKGRAVAKASRGAVKAYSAGRSAAQAAGDAAGRAKQSLKNKYARAKRSAGDAADSAKSKAKGAVGRFARKVADKAGRVASRLGEEFDTYDLVLEYLCVEGYAETLEDAEWIMANELTFEDIEGILEAYKEPDLQKMKRQEYRHTKKAVSQRGGSRGSSKNRASKMSSIRGALERGEDPRADGYGGKRAERGNPPEDHRAAFSKNPLNNPPRRVKKPGV